ncbi:hypothetical protein [Dactylosporangium sp. CA-092794]|uniref:hypothetical protein n=1 Tax=Dactylosporangium sp. CA-092794 TaxID=3239929 RepID=UPI003D903C9D
MAAGIAVESVRVSRSTLGTTEPVHFTDFDTLAADIGGAGLYVRFAYDGGYGVGVASRDRVVRLTPQVVGGIASSGGCPVSRSLIRRGGGRVGVVAEFDRAADLAAGSATSVIERPGDAAPGAAPDA